MDIDNTKFKELTKVLGKVPENMAPGKIIVLNGTSSAGKTTISKLLQKNIYDEGLGSYLYFPLDFFEEEALPKKITTNPEQLVQELPLVVYAYSSAVSVACTAGVNVIVDIVLTELNWTQDFLSKVKDLDVTYIGITCDLEQTIQRERERPDKPNGLAEYQYDRVHREVPYDLMIETTTQSPEENVKIILDYLKR